MSEQYTRDLEVENERLRERIKIIEDQLERNWGFLDDLEERIRKSPSFVLDTDIKQKNVDRYGSMIMLQKKDMKTTLENIEGVEKFYRKIVEMIENERP